MPRFSLIVPVFKVERYLPQCMDSILAQPFTDYEVILVDDGSPDACPALCDEYAGKDQRIKVIHRVNGGVSAARNSGLDEAKGDYLIFLDPDDFLVKDCLVKLNGFIDKTSRKDLIFAGHLSFDELSGKYFGNMSGNYGLKLDGLERAGIIAATIEENGFDWSSWSVVYSTALIRENKLRFSQATKASEDLDFLLKAILASDKYGSCEEALFVYRKKRSGSASTEPNLETLLSQMKTFEYWYKYFKGAQLPEAQKRVLCGFFSMIFAEKLTGVFKLQADEKATALKYAAGERDLLNNKYLLQFLRKKKDAKTSLKIKAVILKITGVKTGLKIIGVLSSAVNRR